MQLEYVIKDYFKDKEARHNLDNNLDLIVYYLRILIRNVNHNLMMFHSQLKNSKDQGLRMQVTSCYNCLQGLVDLYLRLNILFSIQEGDKASGLKDTKAYFISKLDKEVTGENYSVNTDYTEEELTLNIVNVRKVIYDNNI